MVLQIIVWYKLFVRRIDGLTKTSKLRSIWRDNERHGLLNSETGASQEVETPNTKHVVWGVGCGVWGVGCGVWGVGCVAWCLVFGVWCLVFGVWCLVFGVWCLVFGVWCLVFGILGDAWRQAVG